MNELSTASLFIILFILIVLSGFFSGSETALMTLNRYRLRHKAQSGHRGAKLVVKLLERPDRLIGLILLGNNLVNTAAAVLACAEDAGVFLLTEQICTGHPVLQPPTGFKGC